MNQTESAGRGLPGLDALRGGTALLVVLHHAAITYGAIGGWYYREVTTARQPGIELLVFFCTVNQAWFMGLFFLLAGYFTPTALARKGVNRFVAGRLLRLGVPWLVYGTLLGPLTIALAETAHGHPFAATFEWLIRHGSFEVGPLWFAQALLMMTAAALVWWALRGALQSPQETASGSPAVTAPGWPGHGALASAALATGAAACLLRLWWPVGTNVWGMQPGYFASYVVLFAFGCRASRFSWLEKVPASLARTWWRVAMVCLPVLPILYFAGAHWPWLRGAPMRITYAFWEPLVAWGILLKLLEVATVACSPSVAWKSSLSRRGFAIYVIHPPVLVGIALLWSGVAAAPLVKFLGTGAAACLACYLLAGVLLRLPGIGRVL